jgi:hypothetical protein
VRSFLSERLDEILDELRTLREDAEDQRADETANLAGTLDSVKSMLRKVRDSLAII